MSLNTYPNNPFPPSTEQIHKGDNEELQAQIDSLKSGFTTLDNEVNGDATVYPYADVITIEDAVPSNLADCSVKIEPVQSGSGDPSPTNVRPITGHTEVTVTVTDDAESPTVTKTYTIALGDTIYGGTVDFDSGVMTVTHAVVDMGTLTWAEQGNPNTYQAQIRDMLTPTNDLLCSEYAAVDYSIIAANMPDKSVKSYGSSSGRFFYLKDSSYADATEVTTALDGVQLYYPLATPTTIQLTPKQIQLLKGTNTLTASTGQISVTTNGVSGSIGAVQEKVNDIAEDVAELQNDVSNITKNITNTVTLGTGVSKATVVKTGNIVSISCACTGIPNDVLLSGLPQSVAMSVSIDKRAYIYESGTSLICNASLNDDNVTIWYICV